MIQAPLGSISRNLNLGHLACRSKLAISFEHKNAVFWIFNTLKTSTTRITTIRDQKKALCIGSTFFGALVFPSSLPFLSPLQQHLYCSSLNIVHYDLSVFSDSLFSGKMGDQKK